METMTLNARAPAVGIDVLQLSDLHVFADPRRTLLGVNTRASFHAVLAAALPRGRPYDVIVVTGDLSQDGAVAGYRWLMRELQPWSRQLFLLAGNHDDSSLMMWQFGLGGFHTERCVICGGWQIVLLNSQRYGAVYGWIDRAELDFLRDCVARNPQLFTAVGIHHLPRLTGSAWLDQQTLQNSAVFRDCLRELPQVKLVLSGHVHQEFDAYCDGVRYVAAPSTALQFEPRSQDFCVAMASPGWRRLRLLPDGTADTQVERLQSAQFRPKYTAAGY